MPNYDALLRRLLFENSQFVDPSTALRGMPGPMKADPMTPNGPLPPVLDATANVTPQARLHRLLRQPPSMIERLTGGGRLVIPKEPIVRKHRISRSLLSGVAQGMNNAAAMRADRRAQEEKAIKNEMGQTADGKATRDYSAQDDAYRALAEMRRARVNEINEPDPTKTMTPEELAWWNARTDKEKAYAERARRAAAARGGGTRRGGSEGGGLTDAEKRARLKILMDPWEKQAAAMMGSQPTDKNKKPVKGSQKVGATSGPEIQGWLDAIRRTYAQKLGIDLGIGGAQAPPTIEEPSSALDPFDQFLQETN